MKESGLLFCPELEQVKGCQYFGKGLCPSCYSYQLHSMRKFSTKHTHRRTPKRGLIRLGTYIEVTPELWKAFKTNTLKCDQCGKHLDRPDFPKRGYFLITRGLLDEKFYSEVIADPHCANIQISTDILERDPKGNQELEFYIESGMAEILESGKVLIPNMKRLKFFTKHGNVILRYKTTKLNVDDFIKLTETLKINKASVMETPLRLPDAPHYYGTTTYLEEAGWKSQEFGRCNSRCSMCKHENGMLLCAARAPMLKKLPTLKRPSPPRHSVKNLKPLPKGKIWNEEAVRCMEEHGGATTIKASYDWFLEQYPLLAWGKTTWSQKVRTALQRTGMRICTNCGSEHRKEKWVKGVKREPVKNCHNCGTKLPSTWTIMPEWRRRIELPMIQ